MQPSQLVWNAQVTTRGRRMPGSCGALPGYTFKISRVPHRAAEGRFLGTSLWVEKRTVHELFCGVRDDIFMTNKEERPPPQCAGTSYHREKRVNGEIAKRTIRLDSAGGVAPPLMESGARRRAQEKATTMTLDGVLSKNIADPGT